jgi:hypothetical protein
MRDVLIRKESPAFAAIALRRCAMPVKEHIVEEAALKPSAEMQELMARFYQAASTDDF